METKLCGGVCKQMLPVEDFNWINRTKGTRYTYCKKCWNAMNKERYRANKQYYIDKANKRKIETKKEVYEKIKEICQVKGCMDCGESDPVVLQFDHVKGDKFKAVSTMISTGYSWKAISAEIDKCVLRCANCHMRKTARDFNWYACLSESSAGEMDIIYPSEG